MSKSIKILLVDDSPTQTNILRSYLEEEEYSVDIETDGVKALNYLRKCKYLPSLILSDIEMLKAGFARNPKAICF